MRLKRFLVWVGDEYYPMGMDDFVGSFETLEQARNIFVSSMSGSYKDKDWCEILDTSNAQVHRSHYHGPPRWPIAEFTNWDTTPLELT